jgi:hypothetical protein
MFDGMPALLVVAGLAQNIACGRRRRRGPASTRRLEA